MSSRKRSVTTPAPDLWIPLQVIQHGVNPNTWERGQSLFRQQAVCELDIEPLDEHWQILGQVQGTADTPYQLVIEVKVDMAGLPSHWHAECTCPVGWQCKHAVALLLQAAHHGRVRFPYLELPSVFGPIDNLSQAERLEKIQQATAQQLAEQQRQQQAAAQAAQEAMDREWLLWLHSLAPDHSSAASLQSKRQQREDRFLYLLSLAEAVPVHVWQPVLPAPRYPVLVLQLAQSYIKKTGGWAKPQLLQQIPLPDMAVYVQASHADQIAVELLRGMSQLPVSTSMRYAVPQGAVILQGPMVATLLQTLADTGRLFCDTEADGPLGMAVQWAGAQTLAWNWEQQVADGVSSTDPATSHWQLQAQLVAGVQLCANQPPLYLDRQQGRCGPVEAAGWTPALLHRLLQAPPTSSQMLEQHQRALVERLGALPLPAPVEQRIHTVLGRQPTAQLYLQAAASPEQRQHSLLHAQLHFDYRNGLCGWWPPTTPTVLLAHPQHAHQQVLLQRDMAAEQEAIACLQALGLQAADDAGCFDMTGPNQHQQWLQWLDDNFACLRAAGFAVHTAPALDHWIAHADGVVVQLQPEEGSDESSTSPWFALSLGIDINGQRLNLLPWLPTLIALVADSPIDASTGQPILPLFFYLPALEGGAGFVRVPMQTLQPWLAALLDVVAERQYDLNRDRLRLSRLDALRTSAALGEGAVWAGASVLQALLQQLQGQAPLPTVPVPASVQAQLRPYQQQGLNWLQFLRAHGLAGILADDMGLGKTLQTLVHIQVEKEAGRLTAPALIIAPVSLMGNWQREAARFCPQLHCLVLHGKERHTAADDLSQADVVIAPYSLLQRDRERWLGQHWHLVVLDEAQNIKNASTQAAKVVGQLHAQHRLCLSGTPMENHLGEIWSLFHFLMPGFLGSYKRFTEVFRHPIEKLGDSTRLAQLRARVTPFMLRRTKALVAADLPPKIETIMRVDLTGKQADLYETIRWSMEQSVRQALEMQGLAQSQLTILDALLKLRQVCCDPHLLPLEAARKVTQSAKLDYLMEILPEMLAEGRRILLFSQFTSMLELIEAELEKRQLRWVKLTGQSQKRDSIIEQFTSGQVPLFLISLKAGGVGLNLPQADTVIHYDPWWNPAVENQATDRAHRIGQTQNLWVIKLVAQGTIEERILALQERKAQLADSIYSAAIARREPVFTPDDLAELLKPLAR